MYRKRPAPQSPGLLQRQEDFEAEDAWLSTPPADAYDMPAPCMRVNKTKPHHRRTASRVLDDLPIMNPLFEQAEEDGRGQSCPRLGNMNWFKEHGVDVGEVDYWDELVDETPKRGGLLDGVALGNGFAEREASSVGVGPGRGAGGFVGRSAMTGAVHRSTRRGNDAARSLPVHGVMEEGDRSYPVALRGLNPKGAPLFPWRMFFYLLALLGCSVAVEVMTDRGQMAMACGACLGETRDLARRLEHSQVEMLERVASMAMLLSDQALENHQLREELVEAHRFAQYLQQGGRLSVERDSQGTEVSAEEDISNPPTSPVEQFEAEMRRAVWRLRYHVARLTGYIRKRLELPVGSAMYERLKWLESVAAGPIE